MFASSAWRNFALGVGLLVLATSLVGAEPSTPTGKPNPDFSGKPVSTPPVIDGVVNSEEWALANAAEGLVDSNTKEPLSEPTKFWLSYDKDYIYFAAIMTDSEPGLIKATETRSNVSLTGNDFVTLYLDVVGQLHDFNAFQMNASTGNLAQIAGGRASKTEWSGDFESHGRITETGWEVEARIPWKIFRLPAAGPRNLRFNVERNVQRLQRKFIYYYWGQTEVTNVPVWPGVEVPEVKTEQTLKLLPYTYLGSKGGKTIFNSGVDIKAELPNRMELVGSLNPDFRNIQNNILSLDFSYFERLADDTRPFFQEGRQYFQTGMQTRIFASQRIPTFDAGLKVFGNVNENTQFGVMDLSTINKQNAFVSSYSYRPDGTTSIQGAFASLRSLDHSNDALIVNAAHSFGPIYDYIGVQQSFDKVTGHGNFFTGGFFGSAKGATYGIDVTMADANFNPRLGFVRERDVKGIAGSYGIQRNYGMGAIMETEVQVFGDYRTHWNGKPYARSAGASLSITDRASLDIDLFGQVSRFNQFDDELYGASVEKPRGDRYRHWEYGYQWGRLSGTRYSSHSLTWNYRPIENLQLSFGGQWVRHTQDQKQLILGMNYDLDKTHSISGRVVTRGEDTNLFLSYRQSGSYGNEYFVILGDPNATTFRTSLIVKAVFPIDIRI